MLFYDMTIYNKFVNRDEKNKEPILNGYFPFYNFMKSVKRIPNFVKNRSFPSCKSKYLFIYNNFS